MPLLMPHVTPPPSSPPYLSFHNDPRKSRARSAFETLIKVLEANNGGLERQSSLVFSDFVGSDFAQLQDVFSKEGGRAYRYGRFRCNYDAWRHQLSFDMPSSTHECFLSLLMLAISSRLCGLLKEKMDIEGALRLLNLTFLRSRPITLIASVETEKSWYEPDDQVATLDGPPSRLPRLVLEIGKSQSLPELRRKLINFICGSCGEIKFALGFRLFDSSKRVTVVAYEPDIAGDEESEMESEMEDCDEEEVASSTVSSVSTEDHTERKVIEEDVVTANGTVREGALRIPLHVFFGSRIPDCIDPSKGDCISISFQDIADMARQATEVKDGAAPEHKKGKKNRRKRKQRWRASGNN